MRTLRCGRHVGRVALVVAVLAVGFAFAQSAHAMGYPWGHHGSSNPSDGSIAPQGEPSGSPSDSFAPDDGYTAGSDNDPFWYGGDGPIGEEDIVASEGAADASPGPSSIPEPATMLLMATGLIGLGLKWRGSRRASQVGKP